jgi:hypothetical protein
MTITVERHAVDGFTLWATDKQGYLVHKRYIGYTIREAKARFKIALEGEGK